MSLVELLFGNLNKRELKKVKKIADKVISYESSISELSDKELKDKTYEFQDRLRNGETTDDILPEAFAVAREGAYRALGLKPYYTQILGGIVLHQGRIAEQKTGEGKTLTSTLPVYLNALTGKGVHVITVNEYLAQRDSEWMGKVYRFLGLSVSCLSTDLEGRARKLAYMCDITYGTNSEFGFDYLRDNMATDVEDVVQRGLNYALVDEVDSILIDEARTPLIISGKGTESSEMYKLANQFVISLNEDDYKLEKKENQVSLTDSGIEKAEQFFGVENLGEPENIEINHHIHQALRANTLMTKDIDYIIKDGEIVIVDEFTGRLMFGRRFNGGLHQAIEAKEHVEVRSESQTLATITIQNYFRMYNKLAGMTGTAKTEEDEFREIYNMDVVQIPTNKPVIRRDLSDLVYKHEENKFEAVANKVKEIHETGRPVLVGTVSVEKSERLSKLLKKMGIKHDVLNAKQHEKEADIVAQSGRLNHVTIATNMAGRGTDILLGGNPEYEAKRHMRKEGFSEEEINFATGFTKSDDEKLNNARDTYKKLYEKYKKVTDEEHKKVIELGGLAILGTERHESRRIDNQLRGRAGRQGDPGSSQFFLSLDDDLMKLFGSERMKNFVNRLGVPDDEPIEAKMLTRSIESAQKTVEGRNFGIRKYVLQYDNIMNKQREQIYNDRNKVLHGDNLKEDILSMLKALVYYIVEPYTLESKYPEEWDFDALIDEIKDFVPRFKGRDYEDTDYLASLSPEKLKEDVYNEVVDLYNSKEHYLGSDIMRELERTVLLKVVDSMWIDHIDAMEQLKDGIGLQAIGQKDPVAEYAREGFAMFDDMNREIARDTVRYCFAAKFVET